MIEIRCFRTDDLLLRKEAMAIRLSVFVTEQKVDPSLEIDGYEDEAMHYLLLESDKPLGTARYRTTSSGIKLERFAVLPEHRNRRLGEMLLQRVLADIGQTEKQIYLHAQQGALRFYERHGFRVEGEAFEEAGITHYLMVYSKPTI